MEYVDFDILRLFQEEGEIILEVSTKNEQIIGKLSKDQLFVLREAIDNILDPQRDFKKRIAELKRFKRQVYSSYINAQDSEIKEQKLILYLEAKKLVEELESRVY